MKLTSLLGVWIVEGECECSSCRGTGLYKGMGEGEGAAVICYTCDGKGWVKVKETFAKFTKRRLRRDVERVYLSGMGYRITSKDVRKHLETDKDGSTGEIIHFSQAGCSYKDWLKGAKPLPLKELGCPYQHTNQQLQSKDVHNLYKTRCKEGLCGYIPKCKFYGDKAKCWEIYEGGK